MAGFDVRDAPVRGAPGVAIGGEIDIAAVPALQRALDGAIRDSHGVFVVDLSDAEFLDSSGIHLLLRARSLLGRQDRAIVLVCPAGDVRRALDVTGAAGLFTTYPSRDAAARALVPARRS
jgi:anti-sigma B factor antagonist